MSLLERPSDEDLLRIAERRGRAIGAAKAVVAIAEMVSAANGEGRRIALGPNSPLREIAKKPRKKSLHLELHMQGALARWAKIDMLPIYPELPDPQQDEVIAAVKEFYA